MKFWSVYDKVVGMARLFNDTIEGRRAAAKFALSRKNFPELIDMKDEVFDDEDNVEYFMDTDDDSLVH